jgi:hypothetical protein
MLTFYLHVENQLVCSTLNEKYFQKVEQSPIEIQGKRAMLCPQRCKLRKYIPYSLLIPYLLFLISFDEFQLNLENTSTTENASSLLIFKFRGQGHVEILSFHD